MSANNFVRVTRANPTREAYLLCIDTGLARLIPLMQTAEDRQQVADILKT